MKKILIPPYSPRLKNPPYPEHVAEDLRERIKSGPVTLGEDEVRRIIAMLEILSDRCGAAYQLVGQLADYADMYQDPEVSRVMDLLAFPPGARRHMAVQSGAGAGAIARSPARQEI